jgi:hypothetical protein
MPIRCVNWQETVSFSPEGVLGHTGPTNLSTADGVGGVELGCRIQVSPGKEFFLLPTDYDLVLFGQRGLLLLGPLT